MTTNAFNLQIPLTQPTEEEVNALLDTNLEPYLQHLLDTEYLTREELAAYLQFTSYLVGISPYLMDAFIGTYRTVTE